MKSKRQKKRQDKNIEYLGQRLVYIFYMTYFTWNNFYVNKANYGEKQKKWHYYMYLNCKYMIIILFFICHF